MSYLSWLDRFSRMMPRSLLAPLALPLDFHHKTYAPLLFENLHMIEKAMNFLVQCEVRGDYMEFGVFEGRTFTYAYKVARRARLDMRFYAFDSFCGLPGVKGVDGDGEFSEGQFSASRNLFERACRKAGVDKSLVHVVEGFYEQTLPNCGINSRVAFAWIDCDLYESAVPVLDFLTDKLVNGAIIVFDDWFCFKGDPDKGECRACREWLAKNPTIRLTEYCSYGWSGKAFIVKLD
jgi:O-methyltransferase